MYAPAELKLSVTTLSHAQPEIFLRVHCDRFDVHLRDGIVYDAAAAKWNEHLADVLREMINYAELKSERPNVRDEVSGEECIRL